MKPSAPHAYLKTKVLTASPAELRLMLFDGAIRFAEQGRAGLAERDYQRSFDGISRCQAIIMELIAALKPEHDAELCKKLSGLYTFLYTRLIDANSQRDPAVIDEVLKLLRYERETWAMLLQQMAAENGAAVNMRDTPKAQPPHDPATTSSIRGLVGGSVSLTG